MAIEEQVSGLSLAHVAADQVGIALDQRFCVGKLREGAVGGVCGPKLPGRTRNSPAPSGVSG